MNSLARLAVAICATSLFAGCGGSPPPIGAAGAMPQASAIAAHADHGGSWMLPQAKKIKKLLYVSDGDVYVYDYETRALVGTLTGFAGPEGDCVDANGDVWITQAGGVVEYARGSTTPIQTLITTEWTSGCSVSPNGDLAVANTDPLTGSSYEGDIEIWHDNGASLPSSYSNNKCPNPSSPGYDDKGNLYVESAYYPQNSVCLLAVGSKKLHRVSYNQRLYNDGGTQWDGKYLTIADTGYLDTSTTAIDRFRESASGDLKFVGTTVLKDSCGKDSVNQPFIVGAKNTPVNHQEGTSVVGINNLCEHVIDFWRYPKGEEPTRAITGDPKNAQGEAVSIAP